ncbi:MAG: DUF63 family protein [Haloferacaceae archaeon]
MPILPAGFALPPLPYLLGLLVALGAVAWGVRARAPAFEEPHVVALAPWMVLGAALNVLDQAGAIPAPASPLFGTPAVYASVAVAAGATWLLADSVTPETPRTLGGVGTVAAVLAVAWTGAVGVAEGTLRPGPSLIALVAALAVAPAVWLGLRRLRPTVGTTGWAGLLAVFAHTLDGLSTAVGVDWLGYGERTPLSRLIIEFAAGLPTAEYLGGGWLFVIVKALLAAWIVSLLAPTVREDGAEGYALLALVAAVGLGPGVHNLLLFAIGGGA